MPTLVSRLTSTGTYLTNQIPLDEVTGTGTSKFKESTSSIYATAYDEVTYKESFLNKYVVLDSNSGTSWTVPSDLVTLISVEVYGPGGNGGTGVFGVTNYSGNGGGGGGYAYMQGLVVSPGNVIPIEIMPGGIGNTVATVFGGSTASYIDCYICAEGGGNASTSTIVGLGVGGTGYVGTGGSSYTCGTFYGGQGGVGSRGLTSLPSEGGGGGAAGGWWGDGAGGGSGRSGTTAVGGGGGGAAGGNVGSAGTNGVISGAGGANFFGSGGATGVTYNPRGAVSSGTVGGGGAGGIGTGLFTRVNGGDGGDGNDADSGNAPYGGGGGGGGGGPTSGNGGRFGGGGGGGRSTATVATIGGRGGVGGIVITYTAVTNNFARRVTNTGSVFVTGEFDEASGIT